jgi:hypothetical protein
MLQKPSKMRRESIVLAEAKRGVHIAMKEIPLSKGRFTLVDDEDYPNLMSHRWYLERDGNHYYVIHRPQTNGKKHRVCIHNVILGEPPENHIVDHIDGNPLNNQKSNLRFVTRRQNSQNRHQKKTSIFPGVYWNKRSNRWHAKIVIDGVKHNIGYYRSEVEAFNGYCSKLKEIGCVLVGCIK